MKKLRFKRVWLLAGWLASTLTASLLPLGTQAADPVQSITASPASERLSLGPGAAYDGSLKITNTGQTAYTFAVSSSAFSVSGEDYEQSFVPRPDLIDASKWFSFARTNFPAKPGEQVPVSYRIKTPGDIAAGSYYAVVFATALPAGGATGQNISTQKRVGILFYLTVTGKTVSEGSVGSYSLPAIHTSAPLDASLKVENSGNVHFDAVTSLVVADLFGNTKARLESTNLIFPKSTRKIDLQWQKAPAFGLFKVSGSVKYLGKTEALPTRYTLMLSATAFVVMFVALAAIIAYAVISRRRGSNVVRRRSRR